MTEWIDNGAEIYKANSQLGIRRASAGRRRRTEYTVFRVDADTWDEARQAGPFPDLDSAKACYLMLAAVGE